MQLAPITPSFAAEASGVELRKPQFGPLDAGLRKATGAPTRFGYEELIDIGNVALDDNRATLHRGRRYDLSLRRDLRRTTTLEG